MILDTFEALSTHAIVASRNCLKYGCSKISSLLKSLPLKIVHMDFWIWCFCIKKFASCTRNAKVTVKQNSSFQEKLLASISVPPPHVRTKFHVAIFCKILVHSIHVSKINGGNFILQSSGLSSIVSNK